MVVCGKRCVGAWCVEAFYSFSVPPFKKRVFGMQQKCLPCKCLSMAGKETGRKRKKGKREKEARKHV